MCSYLSNQCSLPLQEPVWFGLPNVNFHADDKQKLSYESALYTELHTELFSQLCIQITTHLNISCVFMINNQFKVLTSDPVWPVILLCPPPPASADPGPAAGGHCRPGAALWKGGCYRPVAPAPNPESPKSPDWAGPPPEAFHGCLPGAGSYC